MSGPVDIWHKRQAWLRSIPDPDCCGKPMLKCNTGLWESEGRRWVCWACDRQVHEPPGQVLSPEDALTLGVAVVSVAGPMPGPGDCD